MYRHPTLFHAPGIPWQIRGVTSTIKKAAVSLGNTALFSTAIAVLLWFWGAYGAFLPLLAISLCIGGSICTAFVLFEAPLSARLSPYLTPIPLVAGGLAVGLIFAGTIVYSRPFMFFTEDWGKLAGGLFFGVVGMLIFSTRGRLQSMRAELAESQVQQQRYERQLAESELRLVQAQIEPHFLFNTLSNITSMITTHPKDAEKTLVNLTTLLRSSLTNTRARHTTLGEEVDMLKAYLEIGKIRMQERLSYEIAVPEGLRTRHLPPLLLQPLVENALIHGIEPLERGGHVQITARAIDNDRLQLQVSDNGKGISLSDSAEGTGLRSVRERLEALYDTASSFSLSENRPHGVTVCIEFPCT